MDAGQQNGIELEYDGTTSNQTRDNEQNFCASHPGEEWEVASFTQELYVDEWKNINEWILFS